MDTTIEVVSTIVTDCLYKEYPVHGVYTNGKEKREWDGMVEVLNTEQRINRKLRAAVEELGYRRNGQRAKVCVGKHVDRIGTVQSINWENGEILLRFKQVVKGMTSERWFHVECLLLLDPDWSVVVPPARPVYVPLPAGMPVVKAPRRVSAPAQAPTGWLPTKKS